MRKTLSAILVLFMLLTIALTSCSGDKPQETQGNTEKVTEASAQLTQETVDAAADVIYTFNKPGENNIATSSFTVPSKLVDYDGFDLDVVWEVEGGAGLVSLENGLEENKTTVKVNPYADNDTEFTLKGKVNSGGFTSKEIKFTYVIKQYSIANWAYWAENTSGVTMNVKGVIVAKYPYSEANKNTGVFLLDLDGEHGYFAYRIKCETKEKYDTELAVGNVIVASGTTSIYNGFRELGAGCTYTPVYNDDGSVTTAEVKKISLDDILKEGVDIDKALDQYQATLATITGAKVKSIDWNSNNADTYYEKGAGSVYVTVTKNNVDFKMYLSTSNSLTIDELKAEYEKLGIGYTINVEGPIAWYNGAQIYPCAGGITVTSTDISDADKLASELNKLSIPAYFDKDSELALPAAGADHSAVKFEWSVSGSANASIKDGKLTVKLGATPEEIVLKVKATIGSESTEKEYKISLIPADLSPVDIVNALYALDKGASLPGTYTLTGKIISVDTPYNTEYKNITVTIAVDGVTDKPVQCYRLKGTGAESLKKGDVITVSGELTHYYNSNKDQSTFEFTTGCTLQKVEAAQGGEESTESTPVETTPSTDQPKTPEQILKAAYALEKGEALSGMYTLSGTVSSVITPFDSGFNNVTVMLVCDGLSDYPIQCFRMKGTGADKVKKGDKITVTGSIKKYTNGTVEFDAGCTLDSIDYTAPDEPAGQTYNTPEEIVNALYALGKGEYLEGNPYTLTGDIISVDTAYSAEFNNITVTIVIDGLPDKPVTCYRLKGEGIEDLDVGDTITVKGNLTRYVSSKDESTYEFTSGCTLEKMG